MTDVSRVGSKDGKSSKDGNASGVGILLQPTHGFDFILSERSQMAFSLAAC
jgi:hypothetical protein